MFSMHVACDMHTTLYSQYCDMHVSLNMHGSCMQHAHYMQEISTRACFKITELDKIVLIRLVDKSFANLIKNLVKIHVYKIL